MWIAVLTILSGGLGALVQNNVRKVFSYLIVCHIGYMIAGLGVYTELALVGVAFYLIHDIIIKTNLFMVSGLIFKIKGTYSMRLLGDFYKSFPKLSLLMAVPLFSLVGIPPLSGFWPKLYLIEAALLTQNYLVIGFILLGSFFTLFIIARMWAAVFWKDGAEVPKKKYVKYFFELKPFNRYAMVVPVVLLSIVSLYIGFGAEYIIRVSEVIGSELMDPSAYIEAVLGNQNPAVYHD